MADQLHTKEPWVLFEDKSRIGVDLYIQADAGSVPFIAEMLTGTADYDGKFDIERSTMDANAKRIVACVNACAGVPQDSFDGGWTALGMSQYAKGLEEKLEVLYGKINGVLLMGEIDQASRSLLENALPK